MKIRVDVMLKRGVLDPQGKAIEQALGNLGFADVGEVRVGKVVELDLPGRDKDQAVAQATEMAKKLLANQVIEDYKIPAL